MAELCSITGVLSRHTVPLSVTVLYQPSHSRWTRKSYNGNRSQEYFLCEFTLEGTDNRKAQYLDFGNHAPIRALKRSHRVT